MAFNGNFKPFSLLLTGAPGWLCDAVLPRLGETLPALTRVRCLVQRLRRDASVQEWRSKHASVTEIVRGDLSEPESLRAACAGMRGGVLLHAAALFHPARPADWFAVNRDGTLALAAAAREAGIKRFVFVSTTAAQGVPPPDGLLREELACKPFSAYGRSKYEAEKGLLGMHVPGEFEVVVLRPSQFYGPPVPLRHLDAFKRIRLGQIRLIGRGRCTRSLSYIDDVADGVIACLTHPKAAGEVFNLCDAQPYTEREIVESIAEALRVKIRIGSIPAFVAGAAHLADRLLLHYGRYSKSLNAMGESHRHTGASCEKAQRILGHAPKIKVREGMRRAVAWCREHNLLD